MIPESNSEVMSYPQWSGMTWKWNLGDVLNAGLALVVLVAFLPVMGVIALAILWADGGPVLYRGIRLGLDGRPFTMYKFRTLHDGAERLIGGRLMQEGEGWITPVGRVLRRLKLDELPQLYNILRRDMNFVGPRPVRPLMAEDYIGQVRDYRKRFVVRPGLTGLAQLRGGYYCDPKRKTRYDLFYIRKGSLILDTKLLGLTALRMVISPDCLKRGDRPTAHLTPVPCSGDETPADRGEIAA